MLQVGHVLYLLATGAVLGTAAITAAQLRFERSSVYWLCTAVFSFVFVSVSVLGLGLLGTLSMPWLVLVSVSGLAVTAIYHGRTSSLRGLLDRWRTDLVQFWMVVRQSLTLGILTATTSLIGMWLAIVGFLVPPIQHDSTNYHLPPVVAWIHRAGIFPVEYARPTAPKNVELVFVWNTIFPHSQSFVNLSQGLFLPIGFLGVYVIGREIGLSVENSFLAGFSFVLTPIVLIQTVVTFVDLALACMMIASIAALLRYWDKSRYRYLVLFGASTGFLLGTKVTGVAYAGILGLGLLFVLVQTHGGKLRALIPRLSIVVILVCLLGGFWYLRNWAALGNPIYPVSVELLGVEIFKGELSAGSIREIVWNRNPARFHGPYDQTSFLSRMYLSWFEKMHLYNHSPIVGGYGPQWAIIALPGLLVFGYRAVRDRLGKRLFLLVIFAVPLLFAAPWYLRYNIFLVGLGAVGIGYARESVCVETRSVLTVAVVALLVSSAFFASGLNPRKYDKAIPQSLNQYEDRSSMIVTVGGPPPISPDEFRGAVPVGSQIGIVLRPAAHSFKLYDKDLQNRLINLNQTGNRHAFERAITNREVEFLILSTESPHSDWSSNMSRTRLVTENDQYALFEVDDE